MAPEEQKHSSKWQSKFEGVRKEVQEKGKAFGAEGRSKVNKDQVRKAMDRIKGRRRTP